ncbi:MAG: aspartate aminotransferase family protein [Candidatus Thorarchaeota archaeon]
MNNKMQEEIETYKRNHKKSLQLWERSQRIFPGGVSHNIRDFNMNYFDLGPPFIKKSQDSKLFDVDGNIYTDYWVTHGAAILGHKNEQVIKAISSQLENGIHYGMVNEPAIILGEKIIDATPSIEELRFCTTGTEATMYATRLARAYTNKSKIVKVRGGWHGGNDTLFYYVKDVEKGVESKGIQNQEEAGILSFDYNDIRGFQKLIQENKDDIAAVIMEPVLGAGGAIPPIEGFLETVREETEKHGIVLIYDEIITGFRLGYNSAQGYFGITPDMTTLGKIVGGCTPIGVIGGKREILEQANLKKSGDVWIGGGTFSANPISMVAGSATLDVLKAGGKDIYANLNNLGEKIRNKIDTILKEYNAPAFVTGVGSMICIHWFKDKIAPAQTSTVIKLNVDKEKVSNFQLLMFNREMLIRSGFGYLCTKHTPKDIEKTLEAISESIKIMIQNS